MQIYLPIAELPVNVLLVLFMGLAVGFISGMFGIGGGFLMTPLLIFIGINPAVAVASVASHVAASSFSGAIKDGIHATALTKSGTGTLTLSGANTYSGGTTISGGTLKGGAANAFSVASATAVEADGTLDLGSFDEAIGSLSGAGTVTMGGYDYHGQGRNTGETRNFRAGRCIGASLS